MNLDKPCFCPECEDVPMQVLMPIWITPGNEYIDTDMVDWESGNPQCSNHWWCPKCEDHHFPIDNTIEDVNEDDLSTGDKLIVEMEGPGGLA